MAGCHDLLLPNSVDKSVFIWFDTTDHTSFLTPFILFAFTYYLLYYYIISILAIVIWLPQ